jgi:hypothetical protein
MTHPQADDPDVVAIVSTWLGATGELFVYHNWYASGGSGYRYFVRSLDDYQDLVRKAPPRSDFEVFRKQQYPLRGVVDDHLLEAALALIKDGEWYEIVFLDGYPKEIGGPGSGNSHTELRQDMAECRGVKVGVGVDVLSMWEQWRKDHGEDSLYAIKSKA